MSHNNNCFTDKALIESVEVIDVVASPPQQPAQKDTLIHSEFKDYTSLTTHIKSPTNKNYTSRYMFVIHHLLRKP